MSVIYVLVPIAILIAAGFVVAFVLTVRSGQLDDLDTPSVRMLFEDDESNAKQGKGELREGGSGEGGLGEGGRGEKGDDGCC